MRQQQPGSAVAPFSAEEVASTYGYPPEYRPRPIAEQVDRLRAFFPGLGPRFKASVEADPLPEGADGYFAIPRPEKIAGTRIEALQRIFSVMASKGPFKSYRNGAFELSFLRQRNEDAQRFARLAAGQEGGDILVVPAQLGLRHRGRSARRARAVFSPQEFGLGSYEVGMVLLTHPERLAKRPDLWIDCAGDEYVQERPNPLLKIGTEYHGVPTWYVGEQDVTRVDELSFMTSWFQRAFSCSGAATGFVPLGRRRRALAGVGRYVVRRLFYFVR